MHTAYYMSADALDINMGVDRAGGLPSELPPQFPVSAAFGTPLCFLLQLYAHPERLPLPGILCLQLYQSGEIDDGDDPMPVVIAVPGGAPSNRLYEGRACESLKVIRIGWHGPVNEPDAWPVGKGVTRELMQLSSSKLGGLPPQVIPPEGARFLGQISEALNDFNFGGLQLTFWHGPGDRVSCHLI